MRSREAIASGIADFVCPRCGAEGLWQLGDPLRRRSNSTTTFATCGACGERGFVKLVSGPAKVAEESARREFAVGLDTYRRFPSTPQLGCAAPWHVSGRLLVFACVDGRSPVETLRSGHIDEALRLAEAMGHWLALFHDCDADQKPTQAHSFMGRLEALRERWQQARAVPRSVTCSLDTLSAPDPRGNTALVRQHGDAKPDNFLYDGRMLVGVDIDGRHWNVPENDLAQLDIQLRLSCVAVWNTPDPVRLRMLSSALVQGYSSAAPLNDAVLAAYRRLYFLSFWVSRRERGTVARWRWDRTFQQLANTLGD